MIKTTLLRLIIRPGRTTLDDTIDSVKDARGAVATYTYNNNRHLVNTITYAAPSGVTSTHPVSFEYDAVGNRTSMNDGLGSMSYSYDQLSRLTGETRAFVMGAYSITYGYNLADKLTSDVDPFGASFAYERWIAVR